jgi:hypothetical protein
MTKMRLPIHSLAFGCTPRGEALLGRQGLKQEAAAVQPIHPVNNNRRRNAEVPRPETPADSRWLRTMGALIQ